MFDSILFGDVFSYGEKQYIFLVKTEAVVYAAQILSPVDTNKVERLAGVRTSQGRDLITSQMGLFCYVVLKTEQFRERAAHLNNAGKDDFRFVVNKLPVKVCDEDRRLIRDEILKERSPVPIELKDLVRELDIK